MFLFITGIDPNEMHRITGDNAKLKDQQEVKSIQNANTMLHQPRFMMLLQFLGPTPDIHQKGCVCEI